LPTVIGHCDHRSSVIGDRSSINGDPVHRSSARISINDQRYRSTINDIDAPMIDSRLADEPCADTMLAGLMTR
jgi:hypothetical protein